MKKLLIGIFVALAVLVPASSPASAALLPPVEVPVTQAVLQAQVDSLRAQLISLLMEQVEQLQAQLATLRAERLAAEGRQEVRDRDQDVRIDVRDEEPEDTRVVVREVWCELWFDSEGRPHRDRTKWDVGEERSNGRVASTRECRTVTFYEDGTGIISEEPI